MPATIAKLERQLIPDEDPDASYLEQEGLGFEDRLAAYQRGEFAFLGIRAVAELRIPYGPHGWILQTIESPGLWGIEDDSGATYFDSVYAEELGELRGMLIELGVVDLEPLDAEIRKVEWYAADCPPTLTRFDVETLWVDSILTSSVPVDWETGRDYESGNGWTSYEAPDCPSCGDYGTWNANERCWECTNGSCEEPPDDLEDCDTYNEGPMMNYHYPLADLHRVGDDPNEAASLIRDLPLCVIEWSDGSYSLALTGGGMDLSWEICEAFTRLGYLPPFRFAQDPPRLAGHTINPYLLAACKRTADVLNGWTIQASERLEAMGS